jgi:hypothetical protein
MAHQDRKGKQSECSNTEDLHGVWQWLLAGVSLAATALRADCTWTPQGWAFAAIVLRILLATVWHVGSGLAWAWRAGPSDSSERGRLQAMQPKIPAGALIADDTGLVGYDFWNAILAAGHQLLVRVGSNVKLLKELGFAQESDGIIYTMAGQSLQEGPAAVGVAFDRRIRGTLSGVLGDQRAGSQAAFRRTGGKRLSAAMGNRRRLAKLRQAVGNRRRGHNRG